VSVGICDGRPVLDLDYIEDRDASVDLNVVLTEDGEFVEVQGTGEEATFSSEEFVAMLDLAKKGASELIEAQRKIIASAAASKVQ
jgi:ribonuclease PH